MSRPGEALITIVMPVYNGSSTLRQVFDGLEMQHDKQLVKEIIIIDDVSKDDSSKQIAGYAKSSSYKVIPIYHTESSGLAGGYNEGTKSATTDYVITMHQDIVLTDRDSFSKMVTPLLEDKRVWATYPVLLHPHEVWKQYPFWQKCMFSRLVDKKSPMLTGKFDCFSRKLLESENFFDNKTYRTAGEDSDLKIKMSRRGLKSIDPNVEVIHLQSIEKSFGLKKFIKKEAQYAEAQGVVLRKHGIHDIKGVILSFFRQILLVGLLIPFVNFFAAILIIVYAFMYTKLVYEEEYRDPRIVLVPFINIYLLFVALFVSVRGFIRGRQVI